MRGLGMIASIAALPLVALVALNLGLAAFLVIVAVELARLVRGQHG